MPARDRASVPSRIWVAFCGNGSLALDWLPLVRKGPNPGDAFLLIDYPGYGESSGWPGIANNRAAAKGAFVALAQRLGVPPSLLEIRLNLIGHSLGAAAALDFARNHSQVHQIILLAPFTSVREEASLYVGDFLSRILLSNYDNRAALRELSRRSPPPLVTIFHGLDDRLIPPAMGRQLALEFPSFVRFVGISGANHETIVGAAEDKVLEIFARK